jgi:hypothetical protein
MRSKSSVVLAMIALILAGSTARAELPPGSYDSLRIAAQEALVIETANVTSRTLRDGRIEVVVTARVMSVERSKTGLARGAMISIRYDTYPQGSAPPGPQQLPVLRKGEFYPAFLNADGAKAFSPAAYGESFTMTPEM